MLTRRGGALLLLTGAAWSAGCQAECPGGYGRAGGACIADAGPVDGHVAPVDSSVDATTDGGLDSGVVRERSYLVARAWYPDVSIDGTTSAEGIDLDMRISDGGDSTSCETSHADYSFDEREGIDNQFARLVPALNGVVGEDLNVILQDAIDSGEWLLVVTIGDVDSLRDDDRVTVSYMLADADGALEVDEEGIRPGQSIRTRMALGRVEGRIEAGRVVATAPVIAIPSGDFFRISLATRPGLVARISEDGLEFGSLGGALSVESLVSSIVGFMASLETTARNLIGQVADVDAATDAPERCQSISIGLGFTAVAVHVLGE
jgi:hypothetical protein